MSATVIAVHGGAGDYSRLAPTELERRRAGLVRALDEGRRLLDRGDPALNAVCAAVRVMEDDGAFNAGRGAVRTETGLVERCASVMDGGERRGAGVAVVSNCIHVADLAMAVLREGRHVLLAGAGSDAFAGQVGLEDPDAQTAAREPVDNSERHGTVGAVAVDVDGHVAVATSTGGITGKRDGRVGDSPVIGAGSWASDETCAVSATGNGERILLAAFSRHVHDRIVIARDDLETAIERALAEVGVDGGGAGCIAVNRSGHVTMRFNTRGMLRGWSSSATEMHVLGPA